MNNQAKYDIFPLIEDRLCNSLQIIMANIEMAQKQDETDHERLEKAKNEILKISKYIGEELDKAVGVQ